MAAAAATQPSRSSLPSAAAPPTHRLVSASVFFRHGDRDGYILPAWGEATATKLGKLGVQVDFALEPRLGHSMAHDELASLTAWLHRTLGTGVKGEVEA